jgi:hypothetical protein
VYYTTCRTGSVELKKKNALRVLSETSRLCFQFAVPTDFYAGDRQHCLLHIGGNFYIVIKFDVYFPRNLLNLRLLCQLSMF